MRLFKPRLTTSFLALLLSQTFLINVPAPGAAAELPVGLAQVNSPKLSQAGLIDALGARITQVPEFDFIRHEAERLGVRAYLFGGTAAGYAHYVMWDLQRESGDPRFQADRFDYDYMNIYRSTQDLDIVVDGPAEKAKQLEASLSRQYPHLQGSKSAWEVRPLRETMGDKQVILNNPDFLNQHTDSNSTGLIEITKPTPGEPLVRDVRDWNSREPYFLRDVREGQLHYYYSPRHAETQFAREGRNPPIVSVIRYLTKAFQYELELRPEDLAHVKAVIDAFDPVHGPELMNSYVRNWLLKKDNGRKLVQNAVNIEYAWNTLEKLGLRQKLIAIENNPQTPGSLAWWMNKEPLRSRPIAASGVADGGKTAAELAAAGKLPKDLILAHETESFLAYESITRAHTGDPNVFISRAGTPGESAAHGEGFYLRQGHEGGRGTHWTIRFRLHPDAREGHDFALVTHDYVTLKNKAAIRVIPESLHLTPLEYFTRLALGDSAGLRASDRGVLEKFKRRVTRDLRLISPEQQTQISQVVDGAIAKWLDRRPDDSVPPIFKEWFSLDASAGHLAPLLRLVDSGKADNWIAEHVLSQPHWSNHPELVEKLIEGRKAVWDVAQHVLSKPFWKNHPELVEKLIQCGNTHERIARYVLSQPHWQGHPEFVEKLIEGGKANFEIAAYVLSQPHWKDHPELVEQLMATRKADTQIAQYVLSRPQWKDHPEWVERFISEGRAHREIAHDVLSQPHWHDHPEFVESLIRAGRVNPEIAGDVLSQPHWQDHPEFVEKLMRAGDADRFIARRVLSQPHWRNHPELVEQLIRRGTSDAAVARDVLSQSHWKDHPELVAKLIATGRANEPIAEFVLSHPEWEAHPELVEQLIRGGRNHDSVAIHILSKPHWSSHPEFVQQLIRAGNVDGLLAKYVLSEPHWQKHPALLQATGGASPTVESLRAAFARGGPTRAGARGKPEECSRGFGTLHYR